MPARNPRLNVVLEPDIFAMIQKISKKEGKSFSVVAKELIEDALEKHEDLLLSQEAMNREKTSKRSVTHEQAWK